MKTDNKLYCSVHICDYEHRGDSARAYSILNSFGIVDTHFENNGDGNTAFITFSIDYNKKVLDNLLNDLNNNGYELGCVNLWEFESKFALPTLFPKIECRDLWKLFDKGAGYYELLEDDLDKTADKIVIVKWQGYISAIERDKDKLKDALSAMHLLGCNQWNVSRNDLECFIYGITTIENCCKVINQEFFENNKDLLFSFCNQNATRYGEIPYSITYWKRDYPKLMKHLFDIE